MKRYILTGLLIISCYGLFGQVINMGGIDAYTKVQTIQQINNVLDTTNWVATAPADTSGGDTTLTLDHNQIKYAVNSSFATKFTTDTTCYYTGAINQGTMTTLAISNNSVRIWPIYVNKTMYIDHIAVEVTTGASNAEFVSFVYTDNNYYPGSLVFLSDTIDGRTAQVITQLLPRTGKNHTAGVFKLKKGNIYWIGYNSSGAPTLRDISVYSAANILGSATGADAQHTHMAIARTYDETMPSTFPAGAAYVNAGQMPILYMGQQ
jgi:hypothetical protein